MLCVSRGICCAPVFSDVPQYSVSTPLRLLYALCFVVVSPHLTACARFGCSKQSCHRRTGCRIMRPWAPKASTCTLRGRMKISGRCSNAAALGRFM